MTKLSLETLSQLDSSKIAIPMHDRSSIKPGILHLGVGNFHRSHMATFLDDLFLMTQDGQWGIVGAGIMKFDADKRTCLQQQDWLNTLVERDGGDNEEATNARVIGFSMVDFLPVQPDHAPLKQALLDPAIKIVSLTVTEGGYYMSDGLFDPENPNIQKDVQNPDSPTTIFGMIVQALKKRRETGLPPFTVMSCDNVPHNGAIAKSVVVGLAELMLNDSKEHANWIRDTVAFPNSMVDRITIATRQQERDYVQNNFGFVDEWPIFCEPFRQWILEDTFSNGRPALEQVGVLFVDDVTPYETMKIRVLNGGHASLCYPAALLDVQTVAEAMQHPVIRAFLDALQRTEIIPSVPPVPDTDVTEYWNLIVGRFSNPKIGDSIGRICYDGANRQPKFIIPPAADGLRDGRTVDGLALVSAMWCRYCLGKTEAGADIVGASNDPDWDRLHANAVKAQDDPAAWLGMKDIYGGVGRNPKFIESFSSALRTIRKEGAENAMKAYIEAANVGA